MFAIGDVADADLKTAAVPVARPRSSSPTSARSSRAASCRPTSRSPPAIVIPLGPSGGASELPGQDEIAGAETTAAIKGEHMFVDRYRERFGLVTPEAAASTT